MSIVKAYILGKNNPKEYSQVTKAIKAMLFLATPHQGSSYSKVLNKILGFVPTKGRQQYVNDLNVSSVTIRTIDELFRSAIDDLMLASLYEVFPLKMAPLYSKVSAAPKYSVVLLVIETKFSLPFKDDRGKTPCHLRGSGRNCSPNGCKS